MSVCQCFAEAPVCSKIFFVARIGEQYICCCSINTSYIIEMVNKVRFLGNFLPFFDQHNCISKEIQRIQDRSSYFIFYDVWLVLVLSIIFKWQQNFIDTFLVKKTTSKAGSFSEKCLQIQLFIKSRPFTWWACKNCYIFLSCTYSWCNLSERKKEVASQVNLWLIGHFTDLYGPIASFHV